MLPVSRCPVLEFRGRRCESGGDQGPRRCRKRSGRRAGTDSRGEAEAKQRRSMAKQNSSFANGQRAPFFAGPALRMWSPRSCLSDPQLLSVKFARLACHARHAGLLRHLTSGSSCTFWALLHSWGNHCSLKSNNTKQKYYIPVGRLPQKGEQAMLKEPTVSGTHSAQLTVSECRHMYTCYTRRLREERIQR